VKFSVVIPSYNNASFLEQTIQSALAVLPAKDGEIILVDDCSSDESFKIARKFTKKIRLYRNQTNQGQAETTNRALRLAKGDQAVILHSDDVLHPCFYDVLSPLLEEFQSVVMAVGERIEIGSQGEIVVSPAPFYDDEYLIPGVEQAKVFLTTGFLPCQVLFRRKPVLSFGGAQRNYIANLDGLLWFKTALIGDVAYVRQPVCSYRRHDASTTSALNKSVEHLFAYYNTVTAMFCHARDHHDLILDGYRLRAFHRIAELAVRYGREIYSVGDTSLSKRYLLLAEAIDPNICNSAAYNELKDAVLMDQTVGTPYNNKMASYPPPPHSVKLSDLRKSKITEPTK